MSILRNSLACVYAMMRNAFGGIVYPLCLSYTHTHAQKLAHRGVICAQFHSHTRKR